MQHSTIGPSSPSARDSIGAPRLGAQASTPGPSLPQPSGTMSIGSIIEPNMQNGFKSDFAANPGPALHELSHTPTGTVPRTLPPELLYGQDSPLYSSSDSCYSPLSDYLQPQVAPEPFYPPPETLDEHVHSTTIDTYYQPIEHSPLSAGPPTPTWIQYVPAQLSFENETPCQAPVSGIHLSRLRSP